MLRPAQLILALALLSTLVRTAAVAEPPPPREAPPPPRAERPRDLDFEEIREAAQEQRVAELAQIRGDAIAAEWGTQVRNYVLAPYKLVKDTRSGFEAGQVQGVLDGDLGGFIEAYLRFAAKEQQQEQEAAAGEVR